MTAANTESTGEPVELRPFHEQEPFLGTDKKYYGYVSGVGAGKTFAGILRTALNVEQWNPGEMGAIVAPTTTMVKDVILPELRDLGLLNHWEYKSMHTDEPGIHAPNGSRVLILSADNQRTIERLRGLNLAWWWIDEESSVNQRARDILTQRLRVGQYRNGFITTTPKGRNHTYDFFVGNVDGEYQEHGQADVYVTKDRLAILRVPTHANPHTPEDYKQQMDQDHEGQFYQQEVLGKFVEFEGLVYPWFSDDHIVDDYEATIRQVFYGVDWGFYPNPSVVLAIGEMTHNEYVVLEEFVERRVTDSDLAKVISSMQERIGVGPVYCDPSEPGSIETVQRAGVDAMGAVNDVDPGIKHVASLADRLMVMENCQSLINEFGMYRYKDDGEDPVKKHDHAMDALRYGLFTWEQEGGAVNTRLEGMDFI
jgi:PBSX family phage terminase large subunit